MPEAQFKRHIAYKFRIGDILIGKPIFDGQRFSFLELGDKKISRVNLIGNVVDSFERESETKYATLTLDDGSGQIRVKAFGEDVDKIKNFSQGQTVVVIGLLRHFNDEIYVAPEIIKELEPKYLLIRKLEIEKQRTKEAKPIKREQIIAIKDKILEIIKDAEETGGIETEQIITRLNHISSDIINQEIKKLLEEGIIFEPLPGKVRWLG